MKIINGKIIADKVLEKAKNLINKNKIPILTIVLVGEDEGSKVYVERKRLAAEKIGIKVDIVNLLAETSKEEIIKTIIENVASTDGIILQLPLPENSRQFTEEIIANIPIEKDVDCLRLETLQAAASNEINWLPPIVEAVDAVIADDNNCLDNKKICLVGRGKVTGLPLSVIFSVRGYNLTVVDSQTKKIDEITRGAEVIISATGSAHLLNGDKISDGALVIDAGFARKEGKIVGDVDNESLLERDTTLCPSPGGVGPITVAALLLNVVKASRNITIGQ